jgi:hypothetical protein
VSSAKPPGCDLSDGDAGFKCFWLLRLGSAWPALSIASWTAAALAGKIGSDDSDHLEADRIGNQIPQAAVFCPIRICTVPNYIGRQRHDSEDRNPHRSSMNGTSFHDDWHVQLWWPQAIAKSAQQRSVDDRDQFIEQLHSSQISVQTIAMIQKKIDLSKITISSSMVCIAHLYRAQTILTPVAHDHPITIGQTVNAVRRDLPITVDVSKREDTLAQLRRDLDRLLQP